MPGATLGQVVRSRHDEHMLLLAQETSEAPDRASMPRRQSNENPRSWTNARPSV